MQIKIVFGFALSIYCLLTASQVNSQSLGIPVVPLGEGPWVFDTAEQHKIEVSVVARGLTTLGLSRFFPTEVCS